MFSVSRSPGFRPVRAAALALGLALAASIQVAPAQAQVTAFRQAVAEAAAQDDDIAAFYRESGYRTIWTADTDESRARRAALLDAVSRAHDHGLPAARYDVAALRAQMGAARTARDLGQLEVALSRAFLQYARDLQTGALIPRQIDSGIVREIPYRDRQSLLREFAQASPRGYLRDLAPRTAEYARLMKARIQLSGLLARGGWGPSVPEGAKLEPGTGGAAVIALRDRLVAMGYLPRSASASYDGALQKAVQEFQIDHGLTSDGIAGPGTLTEINVPVETRLQSVIVAMERERWLNRPRGERHVLVNLTDFSARIVDDGEVTFETRSVIGSTASDRRTPEFSDMMEYMVINPTWNVPRSITVKEYLPMMQRNRNAAGHLRVVDRNGRTVPRSAINFAAYTARTFPFAMKQPPSDGNALGLVKFMFPNKYNIYLHDTPSKSLFNRESRAFSHGCIRLADPFDFAYALLARQTDDPQGLFQRHLRTGRETVVRLERPVPVHLIYRTAFTSPRGHVNYRRDIYGRDALIWQALSKAGVEMRGVQG